MKTLLLTLAQLLCLGGVTALASAASPAALAPEPSTQASDAVKAATHKAVTVSHEHSFLLPGSPEKTFPLLCPVREYDWLPKWSCEVVSTDSGYAEEDCLFKTHFKREGQDMEMLWICTRYEAPNRIEYTGVVGDSNVFRLRISLAAAPEGTRVTWNRSWISLGSKGDAWAKTVKSEELDQQVEWLRREMEHYLLTGRMLKGDGK